MAHFFIITALMVKKSQKCAIILAFNYQKLLCEIRGFR